MSVFYDFEHFDFARAFGASNVHTAGIGLSARLTRSVEFALQAGGSRVETLFLAAVPVDPIIAAITGQASAIRANYNVRYVPTGRVRLTKQMQRASAEVAYARFINPGNGVYLTSRNEFASATFSYTGLRHWTVAANTGYNKLAAVAQSLGTYTGYNYGLGVTRDLRHGLQWVLRGDGIRNATNNKTFNRTAARVSMGFYWSPGEVPLSLW
jgi:hypothetical protein